MEDVRARVAAIMDEVQAQRSIPEQDCHRFAACFIY
jgi:hypothetical protein